MTPKSRKPFIPILKYGAFWILSVRKLLAKSDIKPENLPREEDLKKLQRRTKSDEKGIAGSTGRLMKNG